MKGVTAVWPGLFDLSMTMGLMGRYTKAVWDAYEKIIAAAKRKGVAVQCTPGQLLGADKDPLAAAKKFYDDGGRILRFGNDINFMSEGCKKDISAVAKIKERLKG